MNIYTKAVSGQWKELVYDQAKYHSYFPKPFMALTIANVSATCFSTSQADPKELWMNYQDLAKNTTAWSEHYQKEHQEEQLGQQAASGSQVQVSLTSTIPQAPYRNRNVFKYAVLTSLRRDIWQVLYASTFGFILLHLSELISEQGVSVSVPFLFIIYLNILSLYANENIVYVYESALFWWFNDLRNTAVIWMVLKGGLITSLAMVLYTVSKFDLRLRAGGVVFTVI